MNDGGPVLCWAEDKKNAVPHFSDDDANGNDIPQPQSSRYYYYPIPP